MEDVREQSSAETSPSEEAAVDEISSVAAPHERTALIKAMFKFVLHMMESSGTADGLRNLIDSTLPHSLKLVVEQPQVFGNSVFALGKQCFCLSTCVLLLSKQLCTNVETHFSHQCYVHLHP
jgi:E3 ubiquitin-protein ligase HUWE1